MAIVTIPDQNKTIEGYQNIKEFLNSFEVFYDRWEAGATLTNDSSQDEILAAYEKDLKPFMEKSKAFEGVTLAIIKIWKKR